MPEGGPRYPEIDPSDDETNPHEIDSRVAQPDVKDTEDETTTPIDSVEGFTPEQLEQGAKE